MKIHNFISFLSVLLLSGANAIAGGKVSIQTPTTLTFVSGAAVQADPPGAAFKFTVLDQHSPAKPVASKPMSLMENFPATNVLYYADGNNTYPQAMLAASGNVASSVGTDASGAITDTPVQIGPSNANLNMNCTTIAAAGHTVFKIVRVINTHDYYIRYNVSTWQQNTGILISQTQTIRVTVAGSPRTFVTSHVTPATP
jgi:hypothetical protein